MILDDPEGESCGHPLNLGVGSEVSSGTDLSLNLAPGGPQALPGSRAHDPEKKFVKTIILINFETNQLIRVKHYFSSNSAIHMEVGGWILPIESNSLIKS
jgi:hypothetical protein